VKKYDIKNQKFFYLYYLVRAFKGIKKFFGGIYHLPGYLNRKKN
jgi:hypothetical protein